MTAVAAAPPAAPPPSTPQRDARLTAGPLRVQLPAPALLEQLRWVAKTVPGRGIDTPALAGVLLDGGASGLHLTTANPEVVTTAIVLAPGATGAALLPVHPLVRILAAIGPADVTIEVTDDGRRVTITGGGARYETPTMALADFPELPTAPAALVGQMDRAAVGRLLATGVAASDDETLPILTCVQLLVRGGHLAAAATDRYRLVVSDELAPTGLPDGAAWLLRQRPLKAALLGMAKAPQVLVRADLPEAPDEDAPPVGRRASRQAEWVQLTAGPRSCWLRRGDEKYPQVLALMDQPQTWSMTVSRADLIEAIGQVSVLAERGTPLQASRNQDGHLQLRVGPDHDGGGHTTTASRAVTPAAPGTGEMPTFGFRPGFLLDAARTCPGQTITLRGGIATKPVIITGADERHRYLLMPIRLAG